MDQGEQPMSNETVSKHRAVFNEPPTKTPSDTAVDGPLMGNGDMGVALTSHGKDHHFILCKNDLWRLEHQYQKSCPVPLGQLSLTLYGYARADYRVTQNLATATTTTLLERPNMSLTMTSYVAATRNLLVIQIAATGIPAHARASLDISSGRGSEVATGGADGIFWGTRAFTKGVDHPTAAAAALALCEDSCGDPPDLASGVKEADGASEPPPATFASTDTRSAGGGSPSAFASTDTTFFALRAPQVKSPVGGSQSRVRLDSDGSFVIRPEQPVTLVLAMESSFGYADPLEAAQASLVDLDGIRPAHEAWWADYWGKSSVSIDDPVIEKQYYLSLYGMGSCSRDPEFPPNIFGWVTTDNPLWEGDYHLNYNHQAPFYGLARGNRLAQADPHDAPFLDFMERAAWHCREIFGHEGGIYPVGIGPKGIETTYNSLPRRDWEGCRVENDGLFFNQRTNGSYGLVNMAPRWYTTLDPDYGRKIYPFVLQMAVFWQHYLTWDSFDNAQGGKAGRFVVENDSCHEGSSNTENNSCVSLALCRLALRLVVDLTQALDEDASQVEAWEHILKHLSVGSLQERDGKTVFRYTENGTDWWPNNTIGIQQIYPAGLIDSDSDPELLQVARNTIEVMQRWHDFNGSNSFFPAAVRVGHDPEVILKELHTYSEDTYPNGFRQGNPHGIENLSTVPNTINEMLCMGHSDVIRLFPVWPRERDAAFEKLRCRGAFLVSAAIKGGVIGQVRIHSEKGSDCTVENPWLGQRVQVQRNGEAAEIVAGERFPLKTAVNEDIELAMAM